MGNTKIRLMGGAQQNQWASMPNAENSASIMAYRAAPSEVQQRIKQWWADNKWVDDWPDTLLTIGTD